MIWPCKKNGQSKDTEGDVTNKNVKDRGLWDVSQQDDVTSYGKTSRCKERAVKKSKGKDCEERTVLRLINHGPDRRRRTRRRRRVVTNFDFQLHL
jgi:hypothetical protein